MNETSSKTDTHSAVHAPKKHTGGCHCGAVRWEAEIDLSKGTSQCNCSFCSRTAYWGTMMKPDAFRLIAGEESVADYQFNSNTMHHYFCKRCGMHTFGSGDLPQLGGAFYSVNLRCADDIDLAGVTVRHFDGKNNNWGSPRIEVQP